MTPSMAIIYSVLNSVALSYQDLKRETGLPLKTIRNAMYVLLARGAAARVCVGTIHKKPHFIRLGQRGNGLMISEWQSLDCAWD